MPEREPGERTALGTGTRAGAGCQSQHDLHSDACRSIRGADRSLDRQQHQGNWDQSGEKGKRQRAHGSDRGLVRNEEHHS